MSEWLAHKLAKEAAQKRFKKAAQRRAKAGQLSLLTDLKTTEGSVGARFRPPDCECGKVGVFGKNVALRKMQIGEWKCFSCAQEAGWLRRTSTHSTMAKEE